MSIFRRADKDATVRYTTDDGEDFIEMRAEFTKKEMRQLFSVAPTGDKANDVDANFTFIEALFDKCVLDWSFERADGTHVKPSVAEYHELVSEAASWIDVKLGEHFRHLVGADVEELEGESTT
jgi:hypothetical protein